MEQGGLAGTVRADERDQLSRIHPEIDAVQHLAAAVAALAAVTLVSCSQTTADPGASTSPNPPGTSTAPPASDQAGQVDRDAQPEETPRLPARVTNADGSTTEVDDVSRIAVLNGDITEVVFALGLGTNVAGTDISATYPADVDPLPKFGYQRSLNAEGILSVRPTVVIGNTDAGPPAVIDQLRQAGVPVVIIPVDHTIAAPARKVRLVGTAFGVPDRAEHLASDIERRLEKASKAAPTNSRPRVVFLYLRTGTQLIAGRGSGFDALVVAAGGVDAATEAGVQGTVPITPEALAAARPDIIVVTTSGLKATGGIDALLAIPGIAQTPAATNRRILDYDDQLLLGGGPRTPDILERLADDIHAEP